MTDEWQLYLKGAKYDGSSFDQGSDTTVYIDTGNSYILMPADDYYNLVDKMASKIVNLRLDYFDTIFVYGTCKSRWNDFADLEFSFDGSNYFSLP